MKLFWCAALAAGALSAQTFSGAGDKTTDYIPEFQGGKSEITLRQLFTHFSGLQPDVPLTSPWTGYQTGINLACTFKVGGPP